MSVEGRWHQHKAESVLPVVSALELKGRGQVVHLNQAVAVSNVFLPNQQVSVAKKKSRMKVQVLGGLQLKTLQISATKTKLISKKSSESMLFIHTRMLKSASLVSRLKGKNCALNLTSSKRTLRRCTIAKSGTQKILWPCRQNSNGTKISKWTWPRSKSACVFFLKTEKSKTNSVREIPT